MNQTILGFRAAASRLAEMSEELNGQSGQLHQASMEQTQLQRQSPYRRFPPGPPRWRR